MIIFQSKYLYCTKLIYKITIFPSIVSISSSLFVILTFKNSQNSSNISNFRSYQRKDGSFSAFGKSDDHGSLWLTTFVMKVFSHAQGLDSGVKDQIQQHVDRARGYVHRQYRDGKFVEEGKLWHKDLQVGFVLWWNTWCMLQNTKNTKNSLFFIFTMDLKIF